MKKITKEHRTRSKQ